MAHSVLKIHPEDNVVVALHDLANGQSVDYHQGQITTAEPIPGKHKIALTAMTPGNPVIMYGVMVGHVVQPIVQGGLITTQNIQHATSSYQVNDLNNVWSGPDVTEFAEMTFDGYFRANGKVGTRNHWLVIPLVFCENRNIRVLQEALVDRLGYGMQEEHGFNVPSLIQHYKEGAAPSDILELDITRKTDSIKEHQVFPNVDGIKFLLHDGGCGGTRQDSMALCNLLASYITHPNVAGATVLSLGCQNAQIKDLQNAIEVKDPQFNKPLFILEQQASTSERDFLAQAIKETFAGLMQANQYVRQPASLSKLTLGLECGGSDGFSGISANPALGYTSDLLVALGGSTILSEFPELHGVEQELINRCAQKQSAEKFAGLMQTYAQRALESGSGFEMNPSPGNIKDGLITDAMKSAGAAKKGGTSPVVDVLDYTEVQHQSGLNLLCTPGNDVESTTGLAGAGANLIVFTTGLGTPTGNPVSPTVKMSTNSTLAGRMTDLIDIDAGTIITGSDSVESKGRELLKLLIKVASGEHITHAERLGQDDFIPWKRGVSL